VYADGEDGVGCDGGAGLYSSRRGSRDIEPIGSAHDDAVLAVNLGSFGVSVPL
jgi:hypothetical protein